MKKIALIFTIALALTYILRVNEVANAQTTYTINTNNILHTIDERVYGHFLEHIFNSVNGGLWGELVWNRSLEMFSGTSGLWHIEDSDIEVILDIDTSFTPGNAYLKEITASSLYISNTFANPDNIQAKRGKTSINKQQVSFTSPKYSAAVVTVDQNPPVGVDDKKLNGMAERFRLYPNNPNPFSTSTIIRHDLRKTEHVILRVMDLSSRIISVLVDKKLEPGSYQVEW